MKIVKKTLLTLLFPVLMFVAMLIITSIYASSTNTNSIFLGADLVRYVILNACMSICVALAIWLQLKNGRFDFSGGASMVLTAIIAGAVGFSAGNHLLTVVVAVICGVVLSCLSGLVYILGRLPIIISTIGMTLLYESLTYLVAGGNGISVYFQDANMSVFGRVPLVLIPAALSIIVFLVFDNLTAAGRKGKILSNNQTAGVNIGIDERRNILVSYVFSGIIIGFAAVIYVSQNQVSPQSGLATSSIMFSYIVPVFMGMFIGLASNDVIGISMAAIGLAVLNYGLNCMNLGAGGWQQIIMGVFVMCFYTLSGQLGNIQAFLNKRKAVRTAVQ